VDTIRGKGLERLVGELLAERLTFEVAGERQPVQVEAIKYYTNLDVRDTRGTGTLDLRDNTVLAEVRLLDDVTIRVQGGMTLTRRGGEITKMNFYASTL